MTEEKKATTIKSLEKSFNAQNEQTEERLEAVENTLGEMKESSEKNHSDVLKAIQAIGLPASIPKSGKTSEDISLNENLHGIEFKKQRSVYDEVELVTHTTDVRSAEFEKKADQMRFDRDILKVKIAPSSSPYPDKTFTLGVNGVQFCAIRGVEQPMPRCFVEVMARAKTSSYTNREGVIEGTNEMTVFHDETKGQRFVFQVTYDPNKELADQWLDRVLND